MRIGILTLPLHFNYGGILQAYALQTILENMGHDVVVFDTDKHKSLPLWKMPFSYGKRLIKKMLGIRCVFFYEQKFNKEYPIITQYTQQFIDKYIHRVIVNDLGKLKEEDFDAIVVGSDQIWRLEYFHNIKNAFLDFATSWNIKRIAYAASFGIDRLDYPPELIHCCTQLIQKFDAVSVRELSGIKICKEFFNIEAKHVLDPTMLLTKDDYMKLVENAATNHKQVDFACYILDATKEKHDFISSLASAKGLIPFYVNSRVEDHDAPLNERIQPPVEQWIRGFQDAKFIVTDSFHSCVFSILFNKPFVVLLNEYRGETRIVSLLNMFGLARCLYSENWNFDAMFAIDWNDVNKRLSDWRRISFDFLNCLKN